MKHYIVALTIWFLLVAGMFLISAYTLHEANQWIAASTDTEASLTQRILFGLSTFWGKFSWFVVPLSLLFALGIATISLVSQKPKLETRNSKLETRP